MPKTETRETLDNVGVLDLEPPAGMPIDVEPYYAGIITEEYAAELDLPVFQAWKNEETGEVKELRVPVVNKTLGPVTFQQWKERVWDEQMSTKREKHPGGLVWLTKEQVKETKQLVKKRVVRSSGARRGIVESSASAHGDIPFGAFCYLITVEEAGAGFESRRGRPQTLAKYEG